MMEHDFFFLFFFFFFFFLLFFMSMCVNMKCNTMYFDEMIMNHTF